MADFKCTCCHHRVSILKYFPDTGDAACRICLGVGLGTPKPTLRALGFLIRAQTHTSPLDRLKTKASALIAHDRSLLGARTAFTA